MSGPIAERDLHVAEAPRSRRLRPASGALLMIALIATLLLAVRASPLYTAVAYERTRGAVPPSDGSDSRQLVWSFEKKRDWLPGAATFSVPLPPEEHPSVRTGVPVRPDPWEASTCEVHDRPLEWADVGFMYGLPMLPAEPYWTARKERFPYARGQLIGGCEWSIDGSVETARVNRCPACTEEERAWLLADVRAR